MKSINWKLSAFATCLLLAGAAVAQSTAFTYQGRLNDNGNFVSGSYDLSFAAFDASADGNRLCAVVTNSAVAVSNGVFATTVDFGNGVFTGSDVWLEIAISTNGANAFSAITPRQLFTPTPYALYANTSGTANTVAASTVSASQLNTAGAPATGQILAYNGTQLVWQAPVIGGSSSGGWSLTGNVGTTSGLHFLGTTDSQPLEFKVNSGRALRLEYGYDSGFGSAAPNVVGGSGANVVSQGVYGALIAGGGNVSYPNQVGGNYASVLGGIGNTASGYSSIAMGNSTTARGDFSSAMGVGVTNNGYASTAMGYHTTASSDFSTVMGYSTTASGNGSTAIGFGAVASGYAATAMGYSNTASGYISGVAGGSYNLADGNTAFVGGGSGNTANGNDQVSGTFANGRFPFHYLFSGSSTVSGGYNNTASASCAAVPGGAFNTAGGDFSLAGGFGASALHSGAFVWADTSSSSPFPSTAANQFLIRATGGVGIGTAQPPPGGLRVDSGGLAVTGGSSPNYPNAVGVFIEKAAGVGVVFAYDYKANGPLSLALNSPGGKVGVGTLNPQYTLDVNGTTRTHTIIITGGSDLAEPFKMGLQTIEKGSVVVIDEDRPGELKLSTQEYDTRVAGIVSGANGINAGIALHQEGRLEGGQNVALTGRVYVLADATHGIIKPGDLLTTSNTPGHAMKASDHDRAQGAILGKAMSGLGEGRGMVLALVTLQ